MGKSSVLGVQKAASRPAGVDADALGPSDNSDSGSDRVGLQPAGVDEEAADAAADISVDRVVGTDEALDDLDEAEDPDLTFMDQAEAGDAMEDERTDASGDDPTDDEMAGPRP